MAERFPLTWPTGQPRAVNRYDAQFQVDFARARNDLLREVNLLGTRNVILSSNCPVRLDGIPYASPAEPRDPGVAVYFDRRVKSEWKPFVIACDHYRKVRWNLRAVGVTIEALRSIQRHGASSMLEQAFTGFAALPPKLAEQNWWEVFGISEHASPAEIRETYLLLVKENHPDRGGDPARMVAINRAFQLATGGAT